MFQIAKSISLDARTRTLTAPRLASTGHVADSQNTVFSRMEKKQRGRLPSASLSEEGIARLQA
jgi:hypothetical protein